jgi:hypothetical protein
MRVLLAIPSYNRPYEIQKKIGYWIKDIFEADVKVFVCPDQLMYYENSIGSEYVLEGAKQGEPNGLTNQLIYIGNYAKENEYDLIFKCDDDMVFKANGYKKNQFAKLINNSLKEIKKRFFDQKEVSAIAISTPMDWLRSEKSGFKARNKNFAGNYIVRTALWSLKPDLYLHDDLIIWLELKVNGHGKTETYFGLYQEALLGKNGGGLQSFDRLKMSKECYEIMKRKYYPEIFLKEIDPDKMKYDIGKAIDYKFYKKL